MCGLKVGLAGSAWFGDESAEQCTVPDDESAVSRRGYSVAVVLLQ